jgi:HEAT repeat protein
MTRYVFMAATALALFVPVWIQPTAARPPATSQVAALQGATRTERRLPPTAWLPQDPADSLYRAAREALNRSEFERAAELFHRISERFPGSGYAPDALYWEAFALYRTDAGESLEEAIQLLDRQREEYPKATTRKDAEALKTRIRGILAKRGDSKSAEGLVATAKGGSSCPSEDDDERIAAMNALIQMNAERAMPIVKQVLARRDACSVRLRRKAVWLAANNETPESADVLLNVARTDPDRDVKLEAIFWLGQVSGSRTVVLLDSLIRSSSDEDVQKKAVFALSQHDSPQARALLHRLAEQKNLSAGLRRDVIFSIGHHSGTREDAEFLRGLYFKLDNEDEKERLIQSLAQIEGEENERWLLALVTNAKEPIEMRKKALFWAGQGDVALADIVALYPRLADREMKEQLIFVLSQRDEPKATDQLMEIAGKEPDRELRRKAIFWLGQKDDPRVQEFLLRLINK